MVGCGQEPNVDTSIRSYKTLRALGVIARMSCPINLGKLEM